MTITFAHHPHHDWFIAALPLMVVTLAIWGGLFVYASWKLINSFLPTRRIELMVRVEMEQRYSPLAGQAASGLGNVLGQHPNLPSQFTNAGYAALQQYNPTGIVYEWMPIYRLPPP